MMGKAKSRRKRSQIQRITLSEAAQRLASELAALPCLAQGDQATLVRHGVAEMIALVNACSTPMRECGDVFATVGSPSDLVTVCGRSFPSAHHAALSETQRFLDWLWFHLDKESHARRNDWWITLSQKGEVNSPDYKEAYQRSINCTGLDPERIIENWERAKIGILELLPSEWRRDFNHIDSRIARERAALNRAKQSDSFVPNDFQRDILKALEGRALNKQALANEVCNGEGSRLYRRGGIKELKAAGKVCHKPRLGYYRPDAPPPSP